jgi:Lon protease-like protein
MFPLGTPLLPGAALPLNVFELRYLMMMDDCRAAASPEFGVALIARGSEVGGGDERTDVGCVARVVRMLEHEDGRRSVLAVGDRRIRIERWLDDDPYPVALVEDWPDENDVVDEFVATDLAQRLAVFIDLVARATDRPGPVVEPEPDESPSEFVCRVASILPFGPSDRQAILAAPDVAERYERVAIALDDLIAVTRFRLSDDI